MRARWLRIGPPVPISNRCANRRARARPRAGRRPRNDVLDMRDLPPKLAPRPQRRALLGVVVGVGLALGGLAGPVSRGLAASRTPRAHRSHEPAKAPATAPPAAPA